MKLGTIDVLKYIFFCFFNLSDYQLYNAFALSNTKKIFDWNKAKPDFKNVVDHCVVFLQKDKNNGLSCSNYKTKCL